jgi:Ca2+-binding RTX toxin-like protein
MDGLGGSDQLYGYGGNDVLIGGAGDDTIVGGSGNDWVRPGAGNDSVEGRSSSNDAVASEINTVDYGDAIGSVTLNLSTIAYDSGAARWYFARGSDIGFDVLRGFSNVSLAPGATALRGMRARTFSPPARAMTQSLPARVMT